MTRQQVLATLEVSISPKSYLHYLDVSATLDREAKAKEAEVKPPTADPVMELVRMLFEKDPA